MLSEFLNRGNSKYHYYGIRVKVTSSLNHLAEADLLAIQNHPLSLSPTSSPRQSISGPGSSSSPGSITKSFHPMSDASSSPNKRMKLITNKNYDSEQPEYKPVINENMPGHMSNNIKTKVYKQNGGEAIYTAKSAIFSSSENQLTCVKSQNYSNKAELTELELNTLIQNGASPHLPDLSSIKIENIQLPCDCDLDDIKKFEQLYKEHCGVKYFYLYYKY